MRMFSFLIPYLHFICSLSFHVRHALCCFAALKSVGYTIQIMAVHLIHKGDSVGWNTTLLLWAANGALNTLIPELIALNKICVICQHYVELPYTVFSLVKPKRTIR